MNSGKTHDECEMVPLVVTYSYNQKERTAEAGFEISMYSWDLDKTSLPTDWLVHRVIPGGKHTRRKLPEKTAMQLCIETPLLLQNTGAWLCHIICIFAKIYGSRPTSIPILNDCKPIWVSARTYVEHTVTYMIIMYVLITKDSHRWQYWPPVTTAANSWCTHY